MTSTVPYPLLADALVATGHYAIGTDHELWAYDAAAGVWRPDHLPPSPSASWVNTTLGAAAGVKHVNETRHLMLHRSDPLPAMPSSPSNHLLIPFRNAVVDPVHRRSGPHDPRYFHTSLIPHDFDYDPEATHPWFDIFLKEVFEGYDAQIQTVWEMIGYSLLPSNPLQRAFWLYGPTSRNGKGTIAELIRRIVGRRNTSTVALREMSTSVNQFKAASMHNKMVNLDLDASSAFIGDTTMFLQVVSNEQPMVEHKRGHPFPLNPPGLIIAASNAIPQVRDATPAYFARWFPIFFPVSFVGREDRWLIDKLTSEIPAILSTAMDALVGLLQRGDFTHTLTSDAVRRLFGTRSDNVQAWLADRAVVDPAAITGIRAIYADYSAWAREYNNGHKLNQTDFRDRLVSLDRPGLRRRAKNGKEGYTLTILDHDVDPVSPELAELAGVDVAPRSDFSMAELLAQVADAGDLTAPEPEV